MNALKSAESGRFRPLKKAAYAAFFNLSTSNESHIFSLMRAALPVRLRR